MRLTEKVSLSVGGFYGARNKRFVTKPVIHPANKC